jgi:hypothetical protein
MAPAGPRAARKLMPVTKRIILLANSVKHAPGRCIAGREIIHGKVPKIGGWIRPVSTIGEGQLQHCHMQVSDGGPLGVLDIVEVHLLSPGRDAAQPENWFIDSSKPWNHIGRWSAHQLDQLVESPADIWCQPGSKSDRASADFVAALPPAQSLYFLELPKAYIHRGPRNQIRLSFIYAGIAYDFSVTDPHARGRLEGHGGDTRELLSPRICVSLAPSFKGYHYKVVATIIE